MKKLTVMLLLTIFLAGCAPAAVNNVTPVKVFFAGENGSVKMALDLAVKAGTVTLVSDMAQIALFFIGLVPCMPVFFFYALAGGWDQAGLDEADEASRMTGFLRPVVNFIFIAPSRWGARLSPLHNRFPITLRPAALAEAQALTEERVKLVTG